MPAVTTNEQPQQTSPSQSERLYSNHKRVGSTRLCGFPDCSKTAKPGGFCISHGGGKKCGIDECTTSVVSRGFCVAHGGGKRCQSNGCAKSAQTGGYCWIHGGGKKCGYQGCTKRAQSGGACISHGGGKRCRFVNCNKVVQFNGLCVGHGGFRRCQVADCERRALANSFCQTHGGSSTCAFVACNRRAVRGGYCVKHKMKVQERTSPFRSVPSISAFYNDPILSDQKIPRLSAPYPSSITGTSVETCGINGIDFSCERKNSTYSPTKSIDTLVLATHFNRDTLSSVMLFPRRCQIYGCPRFAKLQSRCLLHFPTASFTNFDCNALRST